VGSISRDEARKWSRDRIREQIAQLRAYIGEDRDEIGELKERISDLENNPQYAMSRSRDDRIDAAWDAISEANKRIDQANSDIEFLMTLL